MKEMTLELIKSLIDGEATRMRENRIKRYSKEETQIWVKGLVVGMTKAFVAAGYISTDEAVQINLDY